MMTPDDIDILEQIKTTLTELVHEDKVDSSVLEMYAKLAMKFNSMTTELYQARHREQLLRNTLKVVL